jgi:hypothetical protein
MCHDISRLQHIQVRSCRPSGLPPLLINPRILASAVIPSRYIRPATLHHVTGPPTPCVALSPAMVPGSVTIAPSPSVDHATVPGSVTERFQVARFMYQAFKDKGERMKEKGSKI